MRHLYERVHCSLFKIMTLFYEMKYITLGFLGFCLGLNNTKWFLKVYVIRTIQFG